MKPALKRAFEEAMSLVDEAEVNGMLGRRGPKKMVRVDIGPAGQEAEHEEHEREECEACEAGECAEHLKPEDAEGMAAMFMED